MSSVKIDTCPVCGNNKTSVAFSCTDYYATNETFDVEKCTACGFLFTQNFPAEDSIDHYYDTKEYISHSDTKKGIVNKLYHIARNKMMKKKAAIIEKHTYTSSRWLLDIGCGTGYFLAHMSKKGWSVKGIEKNKEAREFAHKNFAVFSHSPKKLSDFEESSFGIVTLWHSLEHIENLNETLKTIRKLLVENGTVFIAVPNSASADADYYKQYWAAYDVPRHLWHFEPNTLKMIANNNGFGIEKMYPMPYDAFYISILSEKYKKTKFALLKGLLVGLKCYIKSINNKELSSSIVYVLRKKEIVNFSM
ncbi:MAG: class I SAM-dependent methyltransferase [Paludibacteraceae bacterium]|nr:class I SAM-dependent methyltransferase [Paludibacteraceae bacterium]MBN2786983.1 class I SAM-dependent methyltransferase [Paludibacteraceae bacterium]